MYTQRLIGDTVRGVLGVRGELNKTHKSDVGHGTQHKSKSKNKSSYECI